MVWVVAVALIGAGAVDAPANDGPQDAPPTYVTDDVAGDESARKIQGWSRAMARAREATANQLDWDATYYDLELDLDHLSHILTGTVTAQGEVVGPSITQVELDLANSMAVSQVLSNGTPCTFTHLSDVLVIDLERSYATGEVFSVEVSYSGNPQSSSFGWDSHGGDPMIWTLSEPYGARDWWPCKDQPADKADAVDIRVTVDSSLIVASNGSLVSVTPNGGRHTYHWRESHPITTYLVSLAIHPYTEYSDWYPYSPTEAMEIKFYVYPDHYGSVQATYAKTAGMIALYASMFGEYPFLDEKYGHAEFEWGGGMEHQTCTSLGGWGETLIAHELAHQWWGDYITCDTFHHIWLNEGFATYAEALYLEDEYGVTAYHDDMAANAYYGPGSIYVEDPTDFGAIFNSNLSYRKASWVLHMLRHIVGDATFFDILQLYYVAFANSTATTAEFQAVAESVSGLDLDAFFQQWIYGEYFPIYAYDWSAENTGDSWQLTLTIEQLQTNQVFVMPVDVEVELAGGGSELHVVQNDSAGQTYVLSISGEPVSVVLDPDGWILKQVMVPIVNPTFDQGVLLVNGVDWSTYGSEIYNAYSELAFTGTHDFAFWDVFNAPGGGYPPALPAPLGHGPVDPEVMGSYSSVVWIGNNYNGDLDAWFQSPNYTYLEAGGNLLLMTRMGQSFISDPLRAYLGIQWTDDSVSLGSATATYPGLANMTRIGTQSYAAIFDRDALAPGTTLLFVDPAQTPEAGIGAWRAASPPPVAPPRLAGEALGSRDLSGSFVFLSGRPYRWNRSQLGSNCDFILGTLFGEGGSTAVATAGQVPAPTLAIGPCRPNPFNPSTSIPFTVPVAGAVRLGIYDVGGRLVRVLLDERVDGGTHRVTWNGLDDGGRDAASGIYFLRIENGAATATTRLVLTR